MKALAGVCFGPSLQIDEIPEKSTTAFTLMSAVISTLWLDIRRPAAASGVIRTAAQ